MRHPQAASCAAGSSRGHHDEQHGREDRADRRAELRHRGVEGVLLLAGVLGGDQDRSAPLAAERQALDEPQKHQQNRAEPAGDGIRRAARR